jgi:hypothetical protein
MIAQKINELVKRYGSLRAAARVLGYDVSYLTRLRNGEKTNPDKKILKKLGLKRIISFKELK